MIWDIIFSPVKHFITFVIGLFPDSVFNTPGFDGFLDMMSFGFKVIPSQPINIAFACILFWLEVNLVWGTTMWILRKIPLLDIS